MKLNEKLKEKLKDELIRAFKLPKRDNLNIKSVNNIKKDSEVTNIPTPKNIKKIENHRIAGVSFKQKEIKSLAQKNDDYNLNKKEILELSMVDEKIYEHNFVIKEVTLEIDKDNEFDKNAVKVIADDVHIGYIKKGSAAHVKKLIESNEIEVNTIQIKGGKYKFVYEDFEGEEESFKLEKDEVDYSALLAIKIK